jgi:hypothetical protein
MNLDDHLKTTIKKFLANALHVVLFLFQKMIDSLGIQ